MSNAYPDDLRAAWKQRILAKGRDVSDALTKILAGKDARLDDFQLTGGEPGERPEEKLRRFLDHLMKTMRRLDAPDFGACTGCGQPIPVAELDALPWADRCRGCAAKA